MKLISEKYNFLKPIKTKALIRMGEKFDGGYVVDSNIINNSNKLISLGLGTDWSFELDYLKLKNKKIDIYDHTISSWPYIKDVIKYFRRLITFKTTYDGFKVRLNNYLNFKKFLNLNNVTLFKEKITFPIKNKKEADIEKIFSRINKDDNIILKCDIEGSEFEIIEQVLKFSNKIDMLIFEFHWINETNNEDIFIKSIDKLKEKFEIIHLHGNNYNTISESGLPIVLEMTLFNNKYRPSKIEYVNNFPVENLDYPNNPFEKDLKFNFKD
tara:strand:+ start:210 stop:1016 length:807 start_codon:yes stop_codon:yes gene_type:complete